MENLIARLRRSGVLFLIGLIFIIGIAFGFVYFQQGQQQKKLQEQITRLSLVVSKPLPSAAKLNAEYGEINHALLPMSVEAALDIIVGIAEESGIDVDPETNKLRIPPVTPSSIKEENVGKGSYQVLSFRNIKAQGDYDNVTAFISDLDSGKTLDTMVLKKVSISQTTVKVEGEEEPKIEIIATLDVDIYTKSGR